MRLLLDTHIFYWSLFESHRLSAATLALMNDLQHEVFVSDVSLWEFAIKHGVGKLHLPERFFMEFTPAARGLKTLTLSPSQMQTYITLPLHHRDPFDRMLVAQAITEGLTIITRDPNIRGYAVATIEA